MFKKDLRKNVIISSAYDTDLFGLLQVPRTPKKPPLVICFHGLGSHKYGSKHYLVDLSKLLALSGIASLRVDFRGSGDSEGEFKEASLTDFLDDALNIILNSLNFPEINKEQIGIFGSSLGASLALLSLKTYSEYIQALALWAPVISGEIWLNDFLTKSKEQTEEAFKSFNVSLNFQEQFLNMNIIPIIQTLPTHLKILHMHGKLDDTVSVHHQEAFEKAVDKNINNLTVRCYENASHLLGTFSKQSNILNEITKWFSTRLI